ncbi:MAG: hypothetical protein WCQ53_04220 [bacterium]
MKDSRVRISTPPAVDLRNCPSCRHKQASSNMECEACGIIFSKYMEYSPLKASLNRFMSPSEISDIRDTQQRFTKVKHDVESKVELIVHCHKNKLLDLAAHHLRQENDRSGMDAIKKLVSSNYTEQDQGNFLKFVNAISRPSIMIPIVLLLMLSVMAILMH